MEHSGGVYKLVVSKNRTLIWIVFLVPEIEEKSSKVIHRRLAIKVLSKGVLKRIVTQFSVDYIPVYMYLAQFTYL